MRGHQTLYTNLLPFSVKTDATRKGKRNVNADKRDQALACRYYYHTHLKRCRYDDALLYLEQEFFLTASVIIKLLHGLTEIIRELVAKGATARTLRKQFPHFAW